MKFLKLPVQWMREDRTTEEIEELENMGVDVDTDEYYRPGSLYVNPIHITAFNSSSKQGRTNIRCTDGRVYEIFIPITEFKQMMQEVI